MDVITIFLFFIFAYHGENAASIFAFLQALFLNIYSGSIFGIFPFIYLSELVFMWLINGLVDIRSGSGKIITIASAIVLKDLLLLLIESIFFGFDLITISIVRKMFIDLIITTSFSPIIISFLERLRYVEVS